MTSPPGATPRLTTPRLILRGWHYSDLTALHEYSRNPHVGPAAGWEPHRTIARTAAVLERFINEGGVWAIELAGTGELAGSIGLHESVGADGVCAYYLGYSLAEKHWGNGYATEAAKRVIEYAFSELGLRELRVSCDADNVRSLRVIEKCGFDMASPVVETACRYDGRTFKKLTFRMDAPSGGS
jgi:putative acetyltransferase